MKEIIFLMIAFVFVITLSYFLTKKLGSLGALRMQGKNMKVLETLQLGMHHYLHLVKVGDKVVVIGSGKDTINYFCEVDIESIDLSASRTSSNIPKFDEYLKKFKAKSNK